MTGGPNVELRTIFEADQQDRRDEAWDRIRTEDPRRRQRVLELIEDGALSAAEDFFHAAMVLQHGQGPDDFLRAHELATRAADLGHSGARWLSSAALDRWLMTQGRPQKYGTQYRAVHGRWVLYEVDEATTDDERAAAGVPPLAKARARAEEMTRRHPPPSPHQR